MNLFWLSFCDTKRPKGSRFLGVAIVRAGHLVEAVRVTHVLGINPGGEVQSLLIDPDKARLVPSRFIERLLSRDECKEVERLVLEAALGSRG